MKKISLINFAGGILLVLIPTVLFPVCSGLSKHGTPMSCFYTKNMMICLGSLVALLGVLPLIIKKKFVLKLSHALAVIISVFCILAVKRIIPLGNMSELGWQVSMCRMKDMACNTGTWPALSVALIALSIINSLILVYLIYSKKEN